MVKQQAIQNEEKKIDIRQRNLVIRASAGTGKTYQLTNRYLWLLLSGVSPRSILAATFTRKAAGEILDRIMRRIAEAFLDDESREGLSKEIFGQNGRQVTREEIGSLLTKVARELNELRISTFDSYFSRMARPLSLELGLPVGWRIVDEAEDKRILDRSILATFSKKEKGSEKISMIPILQLLFKGESLRSLSDEIYKLVKNMIRGIYHESCQKDWLKIEKSGDLTTKEKLNELIESAVDFLQDEENCPKNSGGVSPNQNVLKGLRKLSSILKEVNNNGDWSSFREDAIVQRVLSGENKYYVHLPDELCDLVKPFFPLARADFLESISDMNKATWEVLDRVTREFEEQKEELGGFRFEDIPARLAASEALPDESIIRHRTESPISHLLLDEFQDTSMNQWKILGPFVNHVMKGMIPADDVDGSGIDPLTEAFGGAVSDSPISGTTRTTERVFPKGEENPVVVTKTSFSDSREESLPSTLFCVGDIKQSIYGWRGGVAEIFGEVEKLLPENVSEKGVVVKEGLERLNQSWRSSQVIMDAVNQVFQSIDQNGVFQVSEMNPWERRKPEAFHRAAEKWRGIFETHHSAKNLEGAVSLESVLTKEEAKEICQNAPSLEDQGGSETLKLGGDIDRDRFKRLIEFFRNDDSKDFEDSEENGNASGNGDQKAVTLACVVYRIIELRERTPGARIGVLVRSGEMGNKINSGLSFLGIEVSQEGGVPLTSARSVNAILSVLSLADHPGDSIASYRFATIPELAERFGITTENFSDPVFCQNLSYRIRREIQEKGLGRFVGELVEILLPFTDNHEKTKLQKFQELAFNAGWEEENGRIDRFIESVEQTEVEIPSASFLRVMTIHSAKGLEFDIVVLPQLDSQLVKTDSSSLIISRTERTGPVQAVSRYIKEENQAFLTFTPNDDPNGERKNQIFLDAIEQDWTARMEESLNLLYVAMTRPKHELVMITPPLKKKDRSKSPSKNYANILMEAFCPEKELWTNSDKKPTSETVVSLPPLPSGGVTKRIYSSGNPRWFDSVNGMTIPQSDFLTEGERSRFPVRFTVREEMEPTVTSPSKKSFQRSWKSRNIFTRGLALHSCFELVEWLDRKEPETEEILHFLEEELPDSGKRESMAREFREICRYPEIQSLLSLDSYKGKGPTPVHAGGRNLARPSWEVFRERSYLTLVKPTGTNGEELEEVPVNGIIDRLVILKDGDKVVGADIIDFKSDKDVTPELIAKNDESITKRMDAYRRQLGAYRKYVAEAFGLSNEKISIRLAFITGGFVVDLSNGVE